MKKLSILAVALFSTNLAFASDELVEVASSKAPADEMTEIVQLCGEYAQEDQIPAADVNGYVLQCVNDELENSGYQTVAKLP